MKTSPETAELRQHRPQIAKGIHRQHLYVFLRAQHSDISTLQPHAVAAPCGTLRHPAARGRLQLVPATLLISIILEVRTPVASLSGEKQRKKHQFCG